MNKTGIICAGDDELLPFLDALAEFKVTERARLSFYEGELNGFPAVMLYSGVGKVNAAICAQSMILRFSPNIIINSGVAGGLSDTIATTDIVIADKVVQHDIDMTPVGKNPGYIIGLDTVEIKCDKKITDALCRSVKKLGIHYETGTIASGDQFINGGEKVKYIKTVFNASATEMEGAAIGQVCALNNVPFCVLRSISDKADSVSHIDNQTFEKIASENSAGAIIGFIEDYAQ